MTLYFYLGAGIMILLSIWALGSYIAVRNLEEPSFTVLEKRAGYTIRQYDPYIVAEATVTPTQYRDGLNQGFALVADYIFGNNTTREKISMTTPVLEQPSPTNEKIAMTVPVLEKNIDESSRTISFVLPSKYTLDTLPVPNNDRVQIRAVAGYKAAVLRFGWYGTPERVAAKKTELLTALAAADIEILGEPRAAFYNPPISFPLTLRNEIIVEIK